MLSGSRGVGIVTAMAIPFSNQKNQKLLIGVLVVLLALVAGFEIAGGNRGPVAADSERGGEAPIAHASPGIEPTHDTVSPQAPRPANAAGSADWMTERSGCTVEQAGTNIHISGTNSQNGWRYANGVAGNSDYPVQDFDVSVDFMMPQFEGPGDALVVLQANASNKDYLAVAYQPSKGCYVLQRWIQRKGNHLDTPTVPTFGDETTKYHHLRLKYEAATHHATGWVDDTLIGTADYALTGNVQMVLEVRSDKKGNNIDLYYDHFALAIGGQVITHLSQDLP